MGRFSAPLDPKLKSYLFIAGGSGITPVISNIRHILAHEPRAEVTLFYGNRRTRDIIFREALADLKDRHLGRLRIFHVLSDELTEVPLFSGMMTTEKVTELVDGCSMEKPRLGLHLRARPDDGRRQGGADGAGSCGRAHQDRELWRASGGGRAAAGGGPAGSDGGSATVEVIHHGMRKIIRVPYEGKAILDVAHEENIDAPYACKGGVCCTCKAKLVEGKVDMDVVYGLEPDEIAAGYILTCQSYPRSEKLVVDYDG